MMGEVLRVLLLEDSDDDALLIGRALRRGTRPLDLCRVQTLPEVERALGEPGWDLVLSDHSLAGFTGLEALERVLATGRDIPFILVSGAIGEDRAAEIMRRGAKDFIRKDRLERLLPALERELADREIRRRHRQSEAALRESERRFVEISALMGELIWEVDAEGLYTYLSPACAGLIGYREEEVVGRLHFYDLHPEAGREAFKRAAFEVFERRGRFQDLLNPMVTRDGRLVEVLTNGIPMLDEAGNLRGYRGADRDVTERRRTEREMARLVMAVEQSPVSVVITDVTGAIEYVNLAFTRVTGYTAAEALGQNPRVLKSGVHPPAFYRDMWATLTAGRVWSGEIVNQGKDGGLFTEQATIAPIRDSTGATTSYVAIKADISERKRAEDERRQLEAQLHQSQKLESLGLLAGGVAHDINNVLAAILSLASAHRPGLAEGTPLAEALETITRACIRGRDVVKGLLTFARQDLETSAQVDLNALAQELVRLLDHTTLKRIQLETDLQPGLPPIQGDPAALSHALMNLCVNAVDAMPGGGLLRIRTGRAAGNRVEIRVADTGQGMPPEVATRALEPFFTTKPVGKGTGLGLSMVYGTVKAHGGSLDLQTHPGKGTEVVLSFPGLAEAASVGSLAGPSEGAAQGTMPRRVLLVDDDELVRMSVAPMLELDGCEVATAEHGGEALARFQAGESPDLVLLDLNMPGLSGAETLAGILAVRPTQAVLLCSGYSDQDVVSLLEGRPNVASIQKPFTMDELRQRFRRFEAWVAR
jgi:PAS domain S-box-containing protein